MSEALARQYWLIAYEADRALNVEDFVEGSDVGAVDSIAYRVRAAGASGGAEAFAGGSSSGGTGLWLSLVFLTKRKRCAQMAGYLVAETGRLWIENCRSEENTISIRAEEIVDCLPIRSHIVRSGGELHLVRDGLKRKGDDADAEEIELRRRERIADLRLRVLTKEKQLHEEAAMREQRAKEEARKKLDEVGGRARIKCVVGADDVSRNACSCCVASRTFVRTRRGFSRERRCGFTWSFRCNAAVMEF